MSDVRNNDMGQGPRTTAALLSWVVFVTFDGALIGVFALIFMGAKIEPVMLGVLGGLLTAVTNYVSGVIGYWLGSSSGSRSATAALAGAVLGTGSGGSVGTEPPQSAAPGD